VAVIAGLDEWNRARVAEFSGTCDLPWLTAHDQADLEGILRELYNDRAKCRYQGEKGRAFMEQHWSDQKVAGRLLEFYESL